MEFKMCLIGNEIYGEVKPISEEKKNKKKKMMIRMPTYNPKSRIRRKKGKYVPRVANFKF